VITPYNSIQPSLLLRLTIFEILKSLRLSCFLFLSVMVAVVVSVAANSSGASGSRLLGVSTMLEHPPSDPLAPGVESASGVGDLAEAIERRDRVPLALAGAVCVSYLITLLAFIIITML
jgi:hypothetical protein